MNQVHNTFIPQFLPDCDLVNFIQTSKLGCKHNKPHVYSRLPSNYSWKSAIRDCNWDVFNWMRSRDPQIEKLACSYVAFSGNMPALKILRSLDSPCSWDAETCSMAAFRGRLDILKWLRAQDPPCPWSERTFSGAAVGGNIKVINCLREIYGCPSS